MAKPEEPKQGAERRGGTSDEVDASKGIWPADVPHPKDAEPRMAGELGGGPYDESGRSSLEGSTETERHLRADRREERPTDAGGDARSAQDARPPADLEPAVLEKERREVRGSLPPHRESRPSSGA